MKTNKTRKGERPRAGVLKTKGLSAAQKMKRIKRNKDAARKQRSRVS